MNNETFAVGEKIWSADNPCQTCICLADGSVKCRTIDCGLGKRNSRLLDGCQPVFRDGVCCPVDWVCPKLRLEEPQLAPPPPPISGSVACPPGVNPRSDYVDYLVPPKIEELDRIAQLGASNKTMVTLPIFVGPSAETDPCLAPRPPEGPCEPYLQRWTFDQGTKSCKN